MAIGAEMANGQSGFDPATSYARISERVENQGRDIVDLRSNMNTGFRNLESSIHALSTELRGNSRTQWPVIWSAIGVSFIVLAAVGGLAYQPVVSNQDRLETALVRLTDVAVTRSELDWRAERGAEDRDRTNAALAELRTSSVARAEWAERNRARDQEVADLSRRIEEIRSILGSQYTTRDVLLELQSEVKDLRQRRQRLTSP